jgi:prepilin-type N-terminal cleavage/methylation domain-containing protein
VQLVEDDMNIHRRNRTRGFSLIEVLVVLTLVAAMMAIAVPYFKNTTAKAGARTAADAIVALHARARAGAILRGRTANLVLASGTNKAVVVAAKVTGSGVDTLGKVVDLAAQYGVTVTSSSDSIGFSPRGLGTNVSTVTIVITKSGFSDTLKVSRGGRMKR